MSTNARNREQLEMAHGYAKHGVPFVVVPCFNDHQELLAHSMTSNNIGNKMKEMEGEK